MGDEYKRQITLQQMLQKLNLLYKRQQEIINQVKFLKSEYELKEEEIELLETMIMFQYNRGGR